MKVDSKIKCKQKAYFLLRSHARVSYRDNLTWNYYTMDLNKHEKQIFRATVKLSSHFLWCVLDFYDTIRILVSSSFFFFFFEKASPIFRFYLSFVLDPCCGRIILCIDNRDAIDHSVREFFEIRAIFFSFFFFFFFDRS